VELVDESPEMVGQLLEGYRWAAGGSWLGYHGIESPVSLP
jgi:hypothetical protein